MSVPKLYGIGARFSTIVPKYSSVSTAVSVKYGIVVDYTTLY